ncbi:hypothetical protein Hokovirus_3_229 [Hokovirus HKV1]|uniref:Uncharacterized protein n=1 Tax=Hokovirus HKV1 TaxID=1977638 RepID=A0A1V0SGV1_9VIRU|nr:hypothetical protein Hokovirus_3_229 [Hokovirus HKV1]
MNNHTDEIKKLEILLHLKNTLSNHEEKIRTKYKKLRKNLDLEDIDEDLKTKLNESLKYTDAHINGEVVDDNINKTINNLNDLLVSSYKNKYDKMINEVIEVLNIYKTIGIYSNSLDSKINKRKYKSSKSSTSSTSSSSTSSKSDNKTIIDKNIINNKKIINEFENFLIDKKLIFNKLYSNNYINNKNTLYNLEKLIFFSEDSNNKYLSYNITYKNNEIIISSQINYDKNIYNTSDAPIKQQIFRLDTKRNIEKKYLDTKILCILLIQCFYELKDIDQINFIIDLNNKTNEYCNFVFTGEKKYLATELSSTFEYLYTMMFEYDLEPYISDDLENIPLFYNVIKDLDKFDTEKGIEFIYEPITIQNKTYLTTYKNICFQLFNNIDKNKFMEIYEDIKINDPIKVSDFKYEKYLKDIDKKNIYKYETIQDNLLI